MDYADKLDFMDDDCDIEGFPIENIDYQSHTYIGLIGYARDFYKLTRKLDENEKKKYVHIYNKDSWRGRKFEKLFIISEYTPNFFELEKDAKSNLIGMYGKYNFNNKNK